jgi:hypothetical protein
MDHKLAQFEKCGRWNLRERLQREWIRRREEVA